MEIPIVREKKSWEAYVASFLINDFKGACKKKGLTIVDCGIYPNDISLLLRWNYEGYIDRKQVRECVDAMLNKTVELLDFVNWVKEEYHI